MKMTHRVIALALAMVLVLSLCPVLEVQAAGATTRITLDGYYNYNNANEVLERINVLRAQNELEPLQMEMSLMKAAKQRAVEHYVAPGDTRPDGSELKTVLEPEWADSFLTEPR